MDVSNRVQALERAISRLGIRVVEEELPEEATIDGGLCTIGGEQRLVISPTAPPWRRLEVLVAALRRLPHRGIWLPPEIREMVESQDFTDLASALVPSAPEEQRR